MNDISSLEQNLATYVVDGQSRDLSVVALRERLATLMATDGRYIAGEIARFFDLRDGASRPAVDAEAFRMELTGRLGLLLSQRVWELKLKHNALVFARFDFDQ